MSFTKKPIWDGFIMNFYSLKHWVFTVW